jgi:phage anti-repressor protein
VSPFFDGLDGDGDLIAVIGDGRKTEFSHWIKRRMDNAGLVESVDFIKESCSSNLASKNGAPTEGHVARWRVRKERQMINERGAKADQNRR